MIGGRRPGLGPAAVAVALMALTLWMRWPGVAMYDSVSQYQQALSGTYSDWHPPIMARLWRLALAIGPGTAPLFVGQMLLYWGGLGLIAWALARHGRSGAGWAVLAAGALPLFVGWTSVVLKDAQMAVCLVAATGLAAPFLLAGRPIARPAAIPILLLTGYATLVRGNSFFATVPFGLALFGWAGVARWPARAGLALAIMALVVVLSPILDQRLMGAEASHVERVLPLYDLAGIAHFVPPAPPAGLSPALWAQAERRGCYTPYFWNPYGEPAECGAIGDALAFDEDDGVGLMRHWAAAVIAHPLAYARHRLGHVNDNLRFLVGAGEPDAIPPLNSEPNRLGLGAPAGWGARALVAAAGAMAASPLGWPSVWLAAALALLWAGWRVAGGQAALGRALALSAAVMSLSFGVVSIASDLRYHLWSMIAAALAAVLLVDAGLPRGRAARAAAMVAAVALIAVVARLLLPAPYVPLPARVPPPPAV